MGMPMRDHKLKRLQLAFALLTTPRSRVCLRGCRASSRSLWRNASDEEAKAKATKAKTKVRQGRVLVVTSGKGGVGKTTSTAALGAALAQSGQKVVVVDFDVGLRNLDLVMGAERRVVFDLINVIKGEAKLAQALIRDKRLDTLALCRPRRARTRTA